MKKLIALVASAFCAFSALAFDHSHKALTEVLKKHVSLSAGAKTSTVNYAALKADAAALKRYSTELSAVTKASFDAWSKPEQMAFLINAYNAFTLDLIISHYPTKSIRDIGGVFDNRWKRKFFNLLGNPSFLDQIEHEWLRAPGRYNEPRIHFAVNCASIGCPMLREEAFVAARLDAQLEEQTQRFLSDRSRNRFANGKLEVSKIFDWFKEDWASGYKGIGNGSAVNSREEFFARYAAQLSDTPAEQAQIRAKSAALAFLDYDWSLNEAKK